LLNLAYVEIVVSKKQLEKRSLLALIESHCKRFFCLALFVLRKYLTTKEEKND